MSLQKQAAALVDAQSYANPEQVHELMAKLRKEQPVCWIEPDGYKPMWLVTRDEDIKFIENNTELFLAAPRTTILSVEQEADLEKFEFGETGRGLVSMDGELHRKYRHVTQQWFMPRHLKGLEKTVEETAKKYVDLLESKTPACDFASDVAFWYPLRVVLSLAGIPEEDDLKIVTLTQQLFGHEDDDLLSEEKLTQAEVLTRFFEYFGPLIEERRTNPVDDLVSVIVNSEIDGQPMDMPGILAYLLIMVTAGHDTTSASLAGGLLALMEHPNQLQKLRDNPELIPDAANEMIRWVSPVKHFARTATEDVEVGGQKISRGDTVVLLFASGSRDESVFPDGDQFRVDREDNRHMAFGYGVHLCLGKHLARMEVAAFFRELLPRLESVKLNGEPKYLASNHVSGLKSLPIKFKLR